MVNFSIMTFNVYMDGHKDKEGARKTCDAILQSRVDIVCLQESNPGWKTYLENDLGVRRTYPHRYFHHDQHSYGGRAVLSKHPIVDTLWCDRVFRWWYGALFCQIQLPGDRLIHVLVVHLRAPFPSNPFLVQRQRLEEMNSHLSKLPSMKHLIILGDFNHATGATHCYLQDRLHFQNALREAGNAHLFTISWHSPIALLGFLFDHIYYSPDISLEDCNIHRIGGSDHWPLIAKLRVAAESTEK